MKGFGLSEETDDFYDLVGKLEGALDAADIKDKELVSKWYDFWTPLETRRAAQGNNIDKEKAIKELNMMKGFLLKILFLSLLTLLIGIILKQLKH